VDLKDRKAEFVNAGASSLESPPRFEEGVDRVDIEADTRISG
jgi:hypothetical protein